MQFALLAPGPSASAELADSLRGFRLGVIGCAYQLAPWAEFVAASDASWWRRYPDAKAIPGRYSMANAPDTERVHITSVGTICNSGVLGLEVAKMKGATRILLFGFDMRGSHFFGPYTNGLRNTSEHQRKQHLRQYDNWARANSGIEVLNCTPDSALRCFPVARLEEICGQQEEAEQEGSHECGDRIVRELPSQSNQEGVWQ